MSKYILGISLGHDASAALIVQDGDNAIVIAAVSEERFTRKKHEERFPVSSVNYVISLLPTDGRIEIVAYCTWERDESYGLWWRWLAPLGIEPQDYLRNVLPGDGVLQLRRNIALNPSAIAEDQRLHREMIRGVLKDFTALPLDDVRLVRVEHHVAHALCGWGLSNLEECTILTADGHGDGLSLTLNRASTGNAQGALGIDRLFSIGVEGSLGMFYKYVTQGLGFRRLSQEGKVTGLAAYGDPNVCHDKLMELFLLDAERPGLIRGWNIKRRHIMEIDRRNGLGGRYHPIPAWIEFNAFGLQTVEVVEDLLATGTSPADVAAGAQSVL